MALRKNLWVCRLVETVDGKPFHVMARVVCSPACRPVGERQLRDLYASVHDGRPVPEALRFVVVPSLSNESGIDDGAERTGACERCFNTALLTREGARGSLL